MFEDGVVAGFNDNSAVGRVDFLSFRRILKDEEMYDGM